jgi:hypothetical protein
MNFTTRKHYVRQSDETTNTMGVYLVMQDDKVVARVQYAAGWTTWAAILTDGTTTIHKTKTAAVAWAQQA